MFPQASYSLLSRGTRQRDRAPSSFILIDPGSSSPVTLKQSGEETRGNFVFSLALTNNILLIARNTWAFTLHTNTRAGGAFGGGFVLYRLFSAALLCCAESRACQQNKAKRCHLRDEKLVLVQQTHGYVHARCFLVAEGSQVLAGSIPLLPPLSRGEPRHGLGAEPALAPPGLGFACEKTPGVVS